MVKYQLIKICYSSCPQLLDLCILDVNSLDFPYRTLAAAALCHYTSIEIVKKTSGKMPLHRHSLVGQGILEAATDLLKMVLVYQAAEDQNLHRH